MAPAGARARDLLDAERTRLLRLRSELAEQVAEEQESDRSELSRVDQHPADLGTETADRERDLSLLEQVEEELTEIEEAFGRLEAGTYGHCEVCGRPIAAERLEALPAARRCTEHEWAAERSEGPVA